MRTTTLWPSVALLVLSASGCAAVDGGGAGAAAVTPSRIDTVNVMRRERVPGSPDAAAREIIDDFLHALARLDDRASAEATVPFSRDALLADPRVALLESVMRERGYATRVVSAEGEAGGAVYRAERDVDGTGTLHTLVVGELQMRRRYATSPDGAPFAVGPLFVLGADASGIDTDRSHEGTLQLASRSQPVNRHVPLRYTIGDVD